MKHPKLLNVKFNVHISGFDFTPLAFSTFCGWGDQAKDMIKIIIYQAADRTGISRANIARRIRQKIAMSIMKHNANMILTRI